MKIRAFERKFLKTVLIALPVLFGQHAQSNAACGTLPPGSYKESCNDCVIKEEGNKCVLSCACYGQVRMFPTPSRPVINSQLDLSTCENPTTKSYYNVDNIGGSLTCSNRN